MIAIKISIFIVIKNKDLNNLKSFFRVHEKVRFHFLSLSQVDSDIDKQKCQSDMVKVEPYFLITGSFVAIKPFEC